MLEDLNWILDDLAAGKVAGSHVHRHRRRRNIRVGMEDNVVYKQGQLAESNMQLIERAVRAVEDFGCEAATPDEARMILGLK